ncbi:DegT/DnrJ/EryC1/StrS family aminotransferase [Candidatus Woesearchaeota archaeon]|nr:DegT/DnrJ/EryC1/StrS family aminotransferase [Candidatus Woesearchaeota archaeon]
MITSKPELDMKFFKKEYFMKNGRSALFQALRILGLNEKSKILIPNYIGLSEKEGSGIFDPIQELNVGYEFYELNEDLSINEADFENKLGQAQIKAVLIVHYFGFYPKNFECILKMCKDHGKFVIEDCAHAFNSYYRGKRAGTNGDISFYSVHKFLPTSDGGILRINNTKFLPDKLDEEMSQRALLVLQKADIDQISQKRIENYNYLLEKIKQMNGVHSFHQELPAGTVPLNFPIIIEEKDRNSIYFELIKRCIRTVSLYHTLIPQITEMDNPITYSISKHILNLPIHENISRENIDIMLHELDELLNNDRS